MVDGLCLPRWLLTAPTIYLWHLSIYLEKGETCSSQQVDDFTSILFFYRHFYLLDPPFYLFQWSISIRRSIVASGTPFIETLLVSGQIEHSLPKKSNRFKGSVLKLLREVCICIHRMYIDSIKKNIYIWPPFEVQTDDFRCGPGSLPLGLFFPQFNNRNFSND